MQKEHLFEVSYELLKFFSNGEEFVNFRRPNTSLQGFEFESSSITKSEAIRRHALMTTILEDDTKELDLPFAHSEKERIDLQV